MTGISAAVIAEAFGFPQPIGRLESLGQRGFREAWRLDTGAGCMFVKRFWPHDDLPWRTDLEQALEFEQRAVHAGVDTPAPVAPTRPAFGTVARIDGQGLFRAFPFVEHQPLADSDDVAEWIGTTLARIHRLRRLATRPEPNWWYGGARPAQWLSWLDDGERSHKSWAPALRENLDLVLYQTTGVTDTFNDSPPYAISHRDVEPWNVIMTADRPMLIDWDATGPESIPLEAAYVFTEFARCGRDEPGLNSIRKSHIAYVEAGGEPLIAPKLDRIIGRHLATITTSLRGYFDGGHSDDQIRTRIEELPAVVAKTRSWEQILANATTRP